MHAYLVITSNEDKEREVDTLATKFKAKRVNFEVKTIKEVKDLKSFAQLPFGQPTAIYLKSFEESSHEAQNALLKQLEEPNNNVVFVITARSEDNLLPTIVSRCEVVRVKSTGNSEDNKKVEEFLNANLDKKIAITSEINSREEAKVFLTQFLRHKDKNAAHSADLALTAINQNGNVQLQLTNFAISF